MEPAPEELEALDKALEDFNQAHERLVHQVMRIKRIHEIKTLRPSKIPVEVQVTTTPAPQGKFCDRCQSPRLINKGGGCLRCLDCNFDLGCGGG